MEEKKALARRIKELEKYLEKQRRKWFLGIWLGYSAIAFWLIFDTTAKFFESLIASAAIGLLCWLVNAIVWSNFCTSIRDTTDAIKNLEKRYNENAEK